MSTYQQLYNKIFRNSFGRVANFHLFPFRKKATQTIEKIMEKFTTSIHSESTNQLKRLMTGKMMLLRRDFTGFSVLGQFRKSRLIFFGFSFHFRSFSFDVSQLFSVDAFFSFLITVWILKQKFPPLLSWIRITEAQKWIHYSKRLSPASFH